MFVFFFRLLEFVEKSLDLYRVSVANCSVLRRGREKGCQSALYNGCEMGPWRLYYCLPNQGATKAWLPVAPTYCNCLNHNLESLS